MNGILGKKIGMTEMFSADGRLVPVTVIQAGPCVVTQIKTVETDGYDAIQLGFDEKPVEKLNKPIAGHLKKASAKGFRVLREFSSGEETIKRHGFSRGPETHGNRNHRKPGSIGNSAWPGKVIKGKRLPGHMGADRKTVKNLTIVDIRPEENLLLVKGAVPGSKTGIIEVYKAK